VGDTPYIKKERTHRNDTVAKATADTKSAEARTALYKAGREILGSKAGGLVTELLNHCGGDIQRAGDLLQLSASKDNAQEYVNRILRGDPAARSDDVLAETERLYRDIGVSI